MRIKFTLSFIVLSLAMLLRAIFPHVYNHAFAFGRNNDFGENMVLHFATPCMLDVPFCAILLFLSILFSIDNFYTKRYALLNRTFLIRLVSQRSVQYYLKFCRITGMMLPLFLLSQVSAGQCLNVNNASWNKNSSVASRIIYNDGTQTRLANSASSNARVADATAVNWSTAVYTTPTILPPASGSGTVTVPVGQKQTLSVIYAAPNATPANNTQLWQVGWAYNTAFTGANYNGVGFTGGTLASWNAAWAVDLAVTYASPTATNLTLVGSDNVNTIFYSGTVLPGDSISITLIPQSNNTAVVQGSIFRPSTNTLLGVGAVTVGLYADEAAKPIYPTVSANVGLANMGCIKQVNSAAETNPSTGSCVSGLSSPWTLNASADPVYTFTNDGTQTRMAPKTNLSNRVTSSSLGGPTIIDVATVNQNPVRIVNGDTSIVSATFLAPADASGNQRWILGWVYSPAFTGASYNNLSATANTTSWATNLYIQGSLLYYFTDVASGANIYSSLVAGDKIIGKLVPAQNGVGADLQVIIYRASANATVFEGYYPNVVSTATQAATPMYTAVEIQNGEVNLSCISSSLNTLPSVGGTPTVAQTICSGGTPVTLRLNGFIGNVLKWQYSNDNFVADIHDIASSANYLLSSAQMGALTSSTYYRAVVQYNSNPAVNSSSVLISVNTNGGCVAANPGIVGGTGNYDDLDNDGIRNNIDLDVDNDGVLNATEASSCYFTFAEISTINSVGSGLTGNDSQVDGDIQNLHDGSTATTNIIAGGTILTASPTSNTTYYLMSIQDANGCTNP